jgi:hypothetical protein
METLEKYLCVPKTLKAARKYEESEGLSNGLFEFSSLVES